jgi:hypothetical protein
VDKERRGRNFIFYRLIAGLSPEDHRAPILSWLRRQLLEAPELTALSRPRDLDTEALRKDGERPHPGPCRECRAAITPEER